jgi:hypothetical protein
MLKRVLTRPSTIGCTQADDGTLVQAAEPILDRPTWDRLREILFEPTRFDASRQPDWSNRRKYAMSGLLWCSLCGHWLSGSVRSASKTKSGVERPKVQTFMCAVANGGCGRLRIDYAPVEMWVLGQVFARLDVPALSDAASRPEPVNHDDELRRRIADDERRLERLDNDRTDDLIDRARYVTQVKRVTARIDAARAQLAESQKKRIVIDTGGRSVRDAWAEHEHDVTWRRTFLEQVIDRVTILPHPAGVASTLTRRRGESDEQLKSRRKEHLDAILFERVRVSWRQ